MPIAQFKVAEAIPLDNTNSTELLNPLVVVLPCNVAAAVGLENCDDLRQFQVTFLFQVSQYTSPEEDLGLTNAIGICVQF